MKDSFSFSFRENRRQTYYLLFSRLTTEKLSTEPRRARSRKKKTDANECIVGTRQVSRCIAAVEPASRAWLFVLRVVQDLQVEETHICCCCFGKTYLHCSVPFTERRLFASFKVVPVDRSAYWKHSEQLEQHSTTFHFFWSN